MPLATHATFWSHSRRNTKMRCCAACATKIVANVAVAIPAIFCSHWQLNIFITVLSRVARYLQCMQHIAKNSLQRIFCSYVSPVLLQNLPLATHATFWSHSHCMTKKKCCVARTSKIVPHVAALESSIDYLSRSPLFLLLPLLLILELITYFRTQLTFFITIARSVSSVDTIVPIMILARLCRYQFHP